MSTKTLLYGVGIFVIFAAMTLLAMPIMLSWLARGSNLGIGINLGRYVKWVVLPVGVAAMLIYLLIYWIRR